MSLMINKLTSVGGMGLLLLGFVLAPSAYSKNSMDRIEVENKAHVKDEVNKAAVVVINHSEPVIFDFDSTYDQSDIVQDAKDVWHNNQQQRQQQQNKLKNLQSTKDDRYQDDINDLIFAIDNQEKSQDVDDTRQASVEDKDVDAQAQQHQMIAQIQPHSEPEVPLSVTGECNADALALGIEHFRYADVNASDLVSVEGRRLHKDAVPWLQKMQATAKRDGITLTVGSAYRSMHYQSDIITRKKRQGLTDEAIYSVSAPAGYSEHATGYAVDFYPIDASFAKTKTYQWLLENADKYGWVQSFTEAVSEKSNVMVEPWHWRFEGTPEAKQLFAPRSCYR